MFGNHSCFGSFFILESKSNIYFPKSVFRDLMSVNVGGPLHVSTLYIWFKVELPGNIGRPFSI